MQSALVVCILLFQSGCTIGQQSHCQHHYISQPPEDIVCNPYIHQTLQLECAVSGPNIRNITWHFSPFDDPENSASEIFQSHKYTLVEQYLEEGKSVKLSVENLTEDTDLGFYWCQAHLINDIILHRSDAFRLRPSNMYQRYLECRINLTFKGSLMKCANPILETKYTFSTSLSENDAVSTSFAKIELTDFTIVTNASQNVLLSSLTQFVIIGLVIVLCIISILLTIVLIFLCKKRRKLHGILTSVTEAEDNFNQSSKSTELITKRSLAASSLTISNVSTGDYAEIGPALMTSVRLHLTDGCNSHYSEVLPAHHQNDENPYDEPVSVMPAISEASMLDHSRLVSRTCETDLVGDENSSDNSHRYHTLKHSVGTSLNGSDYDSGTSYELDKHLPVIPEQMLTGQEMPHPTLGPKMQDSNENVVYANNEYDRLTGPHFYNVLEYFPAGYGLSCDSYSKIDPPPMSHDIKFDLHADFGSARDVMTDNTMIISKYRGDYERDPKYMEKTQLNCMERSMSLPNIYQPVEVSKMDPIQFYEQYLIRKSLSSSSTK